MQCNQYKIYFWKLFHMYCNLICIFICTLICTKFYSCKNWVLHHVNAAAINGVHYGARLVMPSVLLHFPELDSKLVLLGPGYNVDLMKDEMEAFWTRTLRASKSLSSRVPSSAAHSPSRRRWRGVVMIA
jgi:hypothetical protein